MTKPGVTPLGFVVRSQWSSGRSGSSEEAGGDVAPSPVRHPHRVPRTFDAAGSGNHHVRDEIGPPAIDVNPEPAEVAGPDRVTHDLSSRAADDGSHDLGQAGFDPEDAPCPVPASTKKSEPIGNRGSVASWNAGEKNLLATYPSSTSGWTGTVTRV